MKTKGLFGEVNVTGSCDYMIEVSYGEKDWGMPQGIREVLANMLDTKTEYDAHYDKDNGYCVILDHGTGLPKKALVMGASSKAADNTCIGTFGEGLKLAFVTSLRNSRKLSIRTIGYGVEVSSTHSDEYDCELMRLYFTDNKQDIGTEVRIECTQEEFDQAMNMFLQFREGYCELDKNLYLPGGFISILGLTTEERPNLLFSYDLADKSLTNRDRNVIKSKALKAEIEKTLTHMKNKNAIKVYLDGLKDAPESEEYKVAFKPKSKKAWVEAINSLYGKDVVFSSSSDGDVKAVYKGFKVIPCPTKAVKGVLQAVGLKSSAMKTRSVKNEKVAITDTKSNKITYPIAKDYVQSWSILDAGREVLANAIDSSPDAQILWKNGRCVIIDNGKGILKKHFVIGNSEKDNEAIGLFGEGFKMASLVLAREKRNMVINTVGCSYKPAIEASEEFGTEIFCFYYENNNRKTGTEISFIATESEVEKIKDMFITFRPETKIISSSSKVDVIDDRNGYIYVNGLHAASINSLFSYNVKEKALVDSRDRNHVDEVKLNQLLESFYNTTSDTEIIKKIMTGWISDDTTKSKSYLREYSLILDPKMPVFWYQATTECFPNCCIASMANWKANFIAEQAGYRVLSNIPPYIMQIISHSVRTADEIAKEYEGKGIGIGSRVVYPITSDYVSNWTEADAAVELISNAIDASVAKYDVNYINGIICIEDDGYGIQRRDLLIGESKSRATGTAVGTFGEGLKLACLSICRNKKKVQIETVGFSITATMQHDEKFNADLLVMDMVENDREKGTKITFPAKEQVMKDATAKFLLFDKDKKLISGTKGIYTGKNTGIYVNGVLIQKTNALYSYNISGISAKRNLSRDRKSFIMHDYPYQIVGEALEDCSDVNVIEDILKNINDDRIEGRAALSRCIQFSAGSRKKWKKIAEQVYPDSCLPSYNAEETLIAQDSNLKVLTDVPNSLKTILMMIGFPVALQAVQQKAAKEKRTTAIPLSALTPEERKAFDQLSDVIVAEYGKTMPSKIKIVASLDEREGSFMTLGEYQPHTDTVYIIRRLLSHPIESLLGTTAHEFEHRFGKHMDRTREFENDLTKKIGELLKKLYLN